jgi:hypothetical protein
LLPSLSSSPFHLLYIPHGKLILITIFMHTINSNSETMASRQEQQKNIMKRKTLNFLNEQQHHHSAPVEKKSDSIVIYA